MMKTSADDTPDDSHAHMSCCRIGRDGLNASTSAAAAGSHIDRIRRGDRIARDPVTYVKKQLSQCNNWLLFVNLPMSFNNPIIGIVHYIARLFENGIHLGLRCGWRWCALIKYNYLVHILRK